MTGIMSLYIGRIRAEVKRRPLYIVSQKVGLEREGAAALVPNYFIAVTRATARPFNPRLIFPVCRTASS
jgi:hypothetical protein